MFVCSAGNKGGNDFHLQHNSNINDTSFTLFKHNPTLNYSLYGCVPYCYGSNSVHFIGYADVANFSAVKIAIPIPKRSPKEVANVLLDTWDPSEIIKTPTRAIKLAHKSLSLIFSPNKKSFPSAYLSPGEKFKSKTIYKFIN